MIYNKEILNGKKVLLQSGLEAYQEGLKRAGILPVYDLYPPDVTYDELREMSKTDAMLFHFTKMQEMMKIMNSSIETRKKIVILCRVVGAVNNEMTTAYNSLREAEVLIVDNWGQDIVEKILGNLAIAVSR